MSMSSVDSLEAQQARFFANKTKPSTQCRRTAKPTKSAKEKKAVSHNTKPVIAGGIVERSFNQQDSNPTISLSSSAKGFPIAQHLSKLRVCENKEKRTTKRPRSLFAQRRQRRMMTSNDAKNVNSTNTSLPRNMSSEKGISTDVLKMLKQMSMDDIAAAQKELCAELPAGLVKRLKKRGEERLASRLQADSRDAIPEKKVESNKVIENRDTDVSKIRTEDDLWQALKALPKDSEERERASWMLADNEEKQTNKEKIVKAKSKMQDVLSEPLRNVLGEAAFAEATKKQKEMLHARHAETMRIDLRGNEIKKGTDMPSHHGLHHHGEEQDAAGYTFHELLDLSRSSFPAQRVTALGALAGYIHSFQGNQLPDPLLSTLPEALATALQDTRHQSATLAALEVALALFRKKNSVESGNDVRFVFDRFRGAENVMNRADAAKTPLVPMRNLVNAHLAKRIYPIMNSALGSKNKKSETNDELTEIQSGDEGVVRFQILNSSVLLLTEMAKQSLTIASEVAHSKLILPLLADRFLGSQATCIVAAAADEIDGRSMQSVTFSSCCSTVALLIVILCQMGRHICAALEERSILSKLREFLFLTFTDKQTSIIRTIQLSALRAWRCSLSYGIPAAATAVTNLFPRLADALRKPSILCTELGPGVFALFETCVPLIAEMRSAEYAKRNNDDMNIIYDQVRSSIMAACDAALSLITRSIRMWKDDHEMVKHIQSFLRSGIRQMAAAMNLVASHISLFASEMAALTNYGENDTSAILDRVKRIQLELLLPLSKSLPFLIVLYKMKLTNAVPSASVRKIVDEISFTTTNGSLYEWALGLMRLLKALGQPCFRGMPESLRFIPERLQPFLFTEAKEESMLADHTTMLRLRLELLTFLRPSLSKHENQLASLYLLRSLTMADGAEAIALELLRDDFLSSLSTETISKDARRELLSFFHRTLGGNEEIGHSTQWWAKWRQRPSQRASLTLRRVSRKTIGFSDDNSEEETKTCTKGKPLIDKYWPLAPLMSLRVGEKSSHLFLEGALTLLDAGRSSKWMNDRIGNQEDEEDTVLSRQGKCILALFHTALAPPESLRKENVIVKFKKLFQTMIYKSSSSPISAVERAVGLKRTETFLQAAIDHLLSDAHDIEILAMVITHFLRAGHLARFRLLILKQIGDVGLLRLIDQTAAEVAKQLDGIECFVDSDQEETNVVRVWTDLLIRKKLDDAPFLRRVALSLVAKRIFSTKRKWESFQLLSLLFSMKKNSICVMNDLCKQCDDHQQKREIITLFRDSAMAQAGTSTTNIDSILANLQ